MKYSTGLLVLALLFFAFSCERIGLNNAIDYSPKTTEISYNTPSSMYINYSDEKIVSIDWFIDEFLHSETVLSTS